MRVWDWPYVRYLVRCSRCKATANGRRGLEEEAIAAWNTRADTSQAAEIEGLRRENEMLRAADRDHLSAKRGMETRLTAEIEGLKRALEPFAKAGDRYDFYVDGALPDETELAFPRYGIATDDHMPRLCLSADDFRAARTALQHEGSEHDAG